MKACSCVSLPLLAFLVFTSSTQPGRIARVDGYSPPQDFLFGVGNSNIRQWLKRTIKANHGPETDETETSTSKSLQRRQLLSSVFGAAVVAFGAGAASPADAADDALFRKNPLTNSFLEQVRIWEQAEADELQYGGELQGGDDGKLMIRNDAYPKLLVPILAMSEELQQIQDLVKDASMTVTDPRPFLHKAQDILGQPKYDKIAFKKVFNAFGDNIYYSDPDRANVYLGGGAVPKASQSLAYLYRNDILTNIEDMRAELAYLLTLSTQVDLEDLTPMIRAACTAMSEYLSVVPPSEMEKAQTLLSESKRDTTQ